MRMDLPYTRPDGGEEKEREREGGRERERQSARRVAEGKELKVKKQGSELSSVTACNALNSQHLCMGTTTWRRRVHPAWGPL